VVRLQRFVREPHGPVPAGVPAGALVLGVRPSHALLSLTLTRVRLMEESLLWRRMWSQAYVLFYRRRKDGEPAPADPLVGHGGRGGAAAADHLSD
jgi:hypothetical protein